MGRHSFCFSDDDHSSGVKNSDQLLTSQVRIYSTFSAQRRTMGSTHSPTNPELPITISQEEPRTPTVPRVVPQWVYPASDPTQAPPILRQTFYSSSEHASEGDTTDSPSKVMDRIHRSLGIRSVHQRPNWHPIPQSQELLKTKNDMWPILDTKIREQLNTYRHVLRENLRKLNIDFGIMLAMYGSSRTNCAAFIHRTLSRAIAGDYD